MNNLNIQRWFGWGLINLAIVAFYGTLMRYKVIFPLPFLEQVNLLHAHSHFAFSAWLSQVLYAGFMLLLFPYLPERKRSAYQLLMWVNLISSFGMLFAFTAQGYKAVSITFSTLSIVVAVAYTTIFIRDSKHFPFGYLTRPWAIAALLWNVLSTLGPFSLAYSMATKYMDPDFYHASIYYYLHFQYNGWFFFGSMAMLVGHLPKNFSSLNRYFNLFVATTVLTFFLSILWIKIPQWLYIITVLAAFLQLWVWLALIRQLWIYFGKVQLPAAPWIKVFFYASGIALTLKFVLQVIFVFPAVHELVFSFRPIIIAYLHLVLLAAYTLFLLGFLMVKKILTVNRLLKIGAIGFLMGVALNELLLALQGLGVFGFVPPLTNEMLLGAAVLLLITALMMVFSQKRRLKNISTKD